MSTPRSTMSYYILPLWVIAFYALLYIPIVVLILFSFNSNAISYEWTSFTTQWYQTLFHSAEIWYAFKNSLMVAVSTVILSITLGVLLVYFGARTYLQRILPIFYANLAIPEMVLAVGLLSFFYFFSVPLGMVTLIASHTLLGLGYVVPLIHVRFNQLDKRLIEASLDLGATQIQTFLYVVLPLLLPSITAAALLVFVFSFDDFILSFFCAGASSQTLPMYIFSTIRAGASPVINALSALLLGIGALGVLSFFIIMQLRRKAEHHD